MPESFGTLLREARILAGLSMGELARKIAYHKSYLSKLENGHKPPNETVARLCDAALGTGGTLSRFVSEWVATSVAPPLKPGPRTFATLAADPPAMDDSVLDGLRAVFTVYRSLGMVSSPRLILDGLTAAVEGLRPLASQSAETAAITARMAEYAGWMWQEAGDEAAALWWTDEAVALDRTPDLASHALVRRSEMALYRHDSCSAVSLAQKAQEYPAASSRTRGLAARGEAQGHALAGDATACAHALERAELLLSRTTPEWAPLGSTIPDIDLARGWTLCDLGFPQESASLLDAHVGSIPAGARRARARFTVRQALAHAQAGEVEHACAVARGVLGDVTAVDSATIRHDLGKLTRTLTRWRNHRAVKTLAPLLAGALTTTPRYP